MTDDLSWTRFLAAMLAVVLMLGASVYLFAAW